MVGWLVLTPLRSDLFLTPDLLSCVTGSDGNLAMALGLALHAIGRVQWQGWGIQLASCCHSDRGQLNVPAALPSIGPPLLVSMKPHGHMMPAGGLGRSEEAHTM